VNDLLGLALAAHGGIERWRGFIDVEASVSVTGNLLSIKKLRSDIFSALCVQAATHEQGMILRPFSEPDRLAFFEPQRVTIETLEEQVVFSCETPLTQFEDQTIETPWDRWHAAYFLGYMLWSFLTTPFLYTYPGFASEELSPHEENGEEWRRLKVVFPRHFARHSRTQIAYFGPDGLLRRHDTAIDLLGSTFSKDYATDYGEFNGIKLPMKHRLHGTTADGRTMEPAPLLAIDFKSVVFR